MPLPELVTNKSSASVSFLCVFERSSCFKMLSAVRTGTVSMVGAKHGDGATETGLVSNSTQQGQSRDHSQRCKTRTIVTRLTNGIEDKMSKKERLVKHENFIEKVCKN